MKKIPIAAVIGNPISHSKSPKLHGYWLKKYGINGHYIPLEVKAEDFEKAVKFMPQMGFVGANVTIPHKEAALKLCDEVSPAALSIGAANTLIFKDGKIFGDNTDAYGFTHNIKSTYPDWRPKKILVLGAGGAARSILYALKEMGAEQIYLANRSIEKANTLQSYFGDIISPINWSDRENHLEDVDTIINTTSLGMQGQPELEISLERARKDTLVTDIVYTPLETKLLKDAKEKGLRVVDGLGMLLYQAIPGFSAWFGQDPIIDNTLRQIMENE